MNEIPLTDPNGYLRFNAAALWTAFTYFHDDEASRVQAALLAETERQRYIDHGPERYEISALSAKVTEWAEGKTGRLTVAGYTALAFLLLEECGYDKPSLYAAAKVVERAIAKYREYDPVPIKTHVFDGSWSVRDQRTPSKERDIRKAYIEFCPVVHLVAAQILSSQHHLLMHLFNRTPETMATMLLTAQDIERRLLNVAPDTPVDFRNRWSVLTNHPAECDSLEAYPLDGGCRLFLESGLKQ